jgi:hypothetical protein
MFVMWEFHPCRHAAYLSDIGYFNWELGVGLDDDEEEKNNNNDDVEGVRQVVQQRRGALSIYCRLGEVADGP